MIKIKMLGLSAILLLALGGSAVGCKQGEATKEGAAPAASGSAGPTAGPCDTYAAKICEKAGEGAQTCEAAKSTTSLMPPSACQAGLREFAVTEKILKQKGAKCDELIERLCKDIGPATETCTMVKTQTKQFPAERCEMMLGHYNEVVQDLKRREAANQPLDAQKQAAIAAGDAPSFGPKDAKVTIVEFSDFQCPYCGKAAEVVEKLRAKYSDRVRFVFRQFPLPMHPEAKVASQAALAAHEQGKFWQYHDLLFKNMRALDRASLEKYAKEVGLNMTQFKQALDSGKYADVVEADLKIGQDAAVQGTPTLFLNGARVQNAIDYDAVAAQIDAALAKG